MERAYDCARELLATSQSAPNPLCGPWLNDTSIALSRAWSLVLLEQYRAAAESFRDAIADLPSTYRRDCGVHLIRAALAHAGDQEVEHAATLGLEALVIGIETGSGQLLTSLAQLDDALAPWNTVPAVADFRTAMKDTILRPA